MGIKFTWVKAITCSALFSLTDAQADIRMPDKITRLVTTDTHRLRFCFFVFIGTISLYASQAFLVALLWCFGDVEYLPKHHNKNYLQPSMEEDSPRASIDPKNDGESTFVRSIQRPRHQHKAQRL
jgi:hypothetical protein